MTYMDYEEITKDFSLSDYPLGGINENGEHLIIDRYDGEDEKYFKVTTFQDNDWIRINYYYKGGRVEEIYER